MSVFFPVPEKPVSGDFLTAKQALLLVDLGMRTDDIRPLTRRQAQGHISERLKAIKDERKERGVRCDCDYDYDRDYGGDMGPFW